MQVIMGIITFTFVSIFLAIGSLSKPTRIDAPAAFQTDTTAKAISVAELKKYAGEYVLRSETKTLPFKAFIDGGKFKVHPQGQNIGVMKYVGDHTFIHTRNADIKIVFTVEDKKVVGVTLHQRGMQISGKPGTE